MQQNTLMIQAIIINILSYPSNVIGSTYPHEPYFLEGTIMSLCHQGKHQHSNQKRMIGVTSDSCQI